MNPATATSAETDFATDLTAHLALCREALELSTSENKALHGQAEYEAYSFYQRRKDLLPKLERSLMLLREWRQRWQQTGPVEQVGGSEVKSLFQTVQAMLMKVLMLDRENQQALLRRGLLPARQLPSPAVQQPHFAADVYRRHLRH